MRMELWSSWSMSQMSRSLFLALLERRCRLWHRGLWIRKEKYIDIETSLGFLEESTLMSCPCRGSVDGEGGGWDGRPAEQQAGATEQLPLRRRARGQGSLRPAQGTAAVLAGPDSMAKAGLQGLGTLGCSAGQSEVPAPWVLELSIFPRGDRCRGEQTLLCAMHGIKGCQLRVCNGQSSTATLVPVPGLKG